MLRFIDEMNEPVILNAFDDLYPKYLHGIKNKLDESHGAKSGDGRPRKQQVMKACSHKHQNKCKCPCIEGGAGPLDFLQALDMPGTGQKLVNSALEVFLKRALAGGGSQPLNAPVMIGGKFTFGDFINPLWYFKKTMQKVVQPVLRATKLDKVVNAIPGVNLVAAMTGATKMPSMPAPPPAAAAPPAAPAAAGSGKRGRGRPRKVKVVGDENILVQDLEGGAIPNFEQMSVGKLRKIYKALDDRPAESKDQLIESIVPYFTPDAPRGRPRTRTPAMSRSPSPTGSGKKSKAKPKDAAYYRERYARRKAEKEMMKVKVI
jgi:hypothetical protein